MTNDRLRFEMYRFSVLIFLLKVLKPDLLLFWTILYLKTAFSSRWLEDIRNSDVLFTNEPEPKHNFDTK